MWFIGRMTMKYQEIVNDMKMEVRKNNDKGENK